MGRLGGGDLRLKGRRQARLGRVLPEEPHEDLHRLGQRCAVLPYSRDGDHLNRREPARVEHYKILSALREAHAGGRREHRLQQRAEALL